MDDDLKITDVYIDVDMLKKIEDPDIDLLVSMAEAIGRDKDPTAYLGFMLIAARIHYMTEEIARLSTKH